MILLVLATACGGAASDASAPSSAPLADGSTTSQPDTTPTSEESENPVTTDSSVTTRAGDAEDSPTADLPAAPDFTLELGTGGEYTLSSTDNPVYLVFWAEW